MLKGGWWDLEQRVWIWYPLLVEGSTCASPPTSSLWDAPDRECRRGTGHSATKEINWHGTSLVHMVKAIK